MNTLDRISQLMEERDWTKYKLAQECNMPLSTVANMFRRKTTPTIATIETVCKAFGLTLSQFFDIETDARIVHLTEEQKQMFDRWTMLTAEQKNLVIKLIENMK